MPLGFEACCRSGLRRALFWAPGCPIARQAREEKERVDHVCALALKQREEIAAYRPPAGACVCGGEPGFWGSRTSECDSFSPTGVVRLPKPASLARGLRSIAV